MAKKTVLLTFDGTEDNYYSLATTCKVLSKARSTLMRLLKSWERVTESKPQRDHSGRWYLTAESVNRLKNDPKLYLKLAGRATKWEDEKAALHLRITCLETDKKKLKDIVEKWVPQKELAVLHCTYTKLLKEL